MTNDPWTKLDRRARLLQARRIVLLLAASSVGLEESIGLPHLRIGRGDGQTIQYLSITGVKEVHRAGSMPVMLIKPETPTRVRAAAQIARLWAHSQTRMKEWFRWES